MNLDLDYIWSLLDKGGLLFALLLIIYSGAKGWWVFGITHQQELETARSHLEALIAAEKRVTHQLETECAVWKHLALEGKQLTAKAVDLAETALRKDTPG